MQAKFKRGNKVQLKSGGPVMTIDDYYIAHDIVGGLLRKGNVAPPTETEYVYCEWFDKMKHSRMKFHQDMLEPVS